MSQFIGTGSAMRMSGMSSTPMAMRPPPQSPMSINTVSGAATTMYAGGGYSSQPIVVTGQHPVPVNNQYLSLSSEFESERRQRMDLQAQMSNVLAELAVCKARLDKLDPPESPLRAAVRRVESRGKVRVNHETGHVQLLAPLAFNPRTTKDEPTAVLRDPEIAEQICRDLAELAQIFNCPMTIEGHTKGGESDFWQTLANRRAMLVADKMVDFGANPALLETRGLPGRLGKNEVRTEVYMDIGNIREENFVQEIDIVRPGYIERDFVQAGRLVGTQNVATGPQIVERDIVVSDGYGGQIVERQLYQPSSPQIVRPATIIR